MFQERIAATELLGLGRYAGPDPLPADGEPILMGLYRIDETNPAANGTAAKGTAANGTAANGTAVAWVLAFPGGDAVLVHVGRGGPPIVTTVASVRRRWTDLLQAELRPVSTRRGWPHVA